MAQSVRVFLDTSTLFAAIGSEAGGARTILKLGEAGTVNILVGPQVLVEIDKVLREKAAGRLPHLAMLLNGSNVEVTPAPSKEEA